MWDVFNDRCPTRQVLNRIADKWTVMIVARLAHRTMRFGALKRDIGGISQKMLAQTLRGLERDGLVARAVYAEVPPRVEYSLTPLGQTLVQVLVQIKQWAEGNIESVLAAQQAYDQAAKAPQQPAAPGKVVRLASRAA
jgi:DNA-binding HxlR family transcriptional regulator